MPQYVSTRARVPGPGGVPGLLFRWFGGWPLDGRKRTDAQFLLPGSKVLDPTVQRVSRWHMRPGWQRSLIRQAAAAVVLVLAGLCALAWAAATWVGVLVLWLVLLVVGSVAGVLVGRRRWAAFRRHRDHVRPLELALRPVLGHPLALPADRWLSIPADVDAEGATVRVALPVELRVDEGTRALVSQTVIAKLGLDHPRVRWHLAGASPSVEFVRAPEPPSAVGYATVAAAMARVPDGQLLAGLGVGGRPVLVDLDTETPHVLVAAGTGAGKSVLLRLLMAQVLAQGGRVIVLDPKRVSVPAEVRRLPGVAVATSVEAMSAALLAVAREVDARYGWIEASGQDDPDPSWPRVLLVAEEVNTLTELVKTWWASVRDPKRDPRTAPALSALQSILLMGRQARVHVAVAGQYPSAQAIGAAGRAQLGVAFLARSRASAWRMVAPEVRPPRASKTPGRWHVVQGGEDVRAVQVAFLSSGDLVEHVRAAQAAAGLDGLPSGDPAEVLASGWPDGQPAVLGEVVDPPMIEDGRREEETVVDVDDVGVVELVTLSEAVHPGGVLHGRVSLSAVRKASLRDAEFPAPEAEGPRGARLFVPSALGAWVDARDAARAASTRPSLRVVGGDGDAGGSGSTGSGRASA